MSNIDDVFELVKSLTKNEKRFFKIFSKRHGDKDDLKYLQLFDIYDSFVVFDKEKIDEEILKKELTNIRNIKHQLNLQVLKCLNSYHYSKSFEIEISNHLQNSQILFEKGLFNQAYKSVNQAKILAKKYDLKLLLLDCLKKEKIIARELYIKEKIEYFASNGLNDEKELLNQYLKICETHHLRNQLILLSREAHNFKEDKLTIKAKVLENQVLDLSSDINKTFETAEAALITQSYFYISKQNFTKSAETQIKLTELYHLYPEQIGLNLSNYLSSLYNLMVSNLILKNYTEVEFTLSKIDKYRLQKNNRLVNLKLLTYLNIGLAFYNQKGNFSKSSSYEPTIADGLIKFNSSIHIFAKVSLHLHLIVSFIALENLEKASSWANKLLNEFHSKSIAKHLLIAKVLFLIITFEQKRFVYLNFKAKQFCDEIDDSENNVKSLKLILLFFNTTNFEKLKENEIKEMIRQLKFELIVLYNDSEEKIIFDVFDIQSWIDSILFNQSYRNLIKDKFDLGL